MYFYILGEGLETGFDLLRALSQTIGDEEQKHCLLLSTLKVIERHDLLQTLLDHLLYMSRGEMHKFVTLISPVLLSVSLNCCCFHFQLFIEFQFTWYFQFVSIVNKHIHTGISKEVNQ